MLKLLTVLWVGIQLCQQREKTIWGIRSKGLYGAVYINLMLTVL